MVTIRIDDSAMLRVRADGALQAEDYVRFAPQLEQVARSHGARVPVLVELGPGLDGWRLYELWQEVQIEEQHRRLLGPVAVIGDAQWATPVRVVDALLAESVRFFSPDDKKQAEDWLRAHAATPSGSVDRP